MMSVRAGRGDNRRVAGTLIRLSAALLVSLAIAGTAVAQTGEVTWPSKQIVRPRDLAVTYPCGGGAVCNIDDFIERQHVCALVVMKSDELVLYRTAIRSEDDPCKSPVERDRFGIASIAKSLSSLLFGFLYQDPQYGAPADLDGSAAELLKAAGVPKYDRRVTLRDLLRMSSGMDWSEDEVDSVLKVEVNQSAELVGRFRQLKEGVNHRLQSAQFFEPGGVFRYSGFDTQLLGIIAEQRLTPDKGFARATLDVALEHFLWQRLPMAKNAEWNSDFGGHPAAHCCAYVSARDFATLGSWILQQYKSGAGPQADWIRASMTDVIDPGFGCEYQGARRDFRFGYQWWIPGDDKRDGFSGIGTEGQYLHMFPEQDVVIVQLGEQLATDSDTCEAMTVHRVIADQLSQN
jgi:CubicO group peptidase (beta-lactamase class C family)